MIFNRDIVVGRCIYLFEGVVDLNDPFISLNCFERTVVTNTRQQLQIWNYDDGNVSCLSFYLSLLHVLAIFSLSFSMFSFITVFPFHFFDCSDKRISTRDVINLSQQLSVCSIDDMFIMTGDAQGIVTRKKERKK
jgi:hypothetical protein